MSISVRGLVAATLLAGTALAATPAFAEEAESPIKITGNVALVSDYRFRGVSLSDGDMALQGGITATHSSGFYVGTWSSTISDKFFATVGDTELDVFGGWSGEVTSGLTVDAGVLFYIYPSAVKGTDTTVVEPYASLSGTFGPAKLKLGVAYAPEQDSLLKDENLYIYGNVDIGIPNTPVTVSGHLGYTDGFNSPGLYFGGIDRTALDYSIGASATVFGPLSVGVTYIGVDGPAVDGLTDDTVVASLTASF